MAFLLFSPPMIRALRAGAKTQTRRVLRAAWAPVWSRDEGAWHVPQRDGREAVVRSARAAGALARTSWHPGDRAWVREAWALPRGAQWPSCDRSLVRYSSTDPVPAGYVRRHGARMPRRFARLGIEVESVRAERLADLSAEDAVAEGVLHYAGGLDGKARGDFEETLGPTAAAWSVPVDDPRSTFAVLWCALHHAKEPAAELLRWVSVVTFRPFELTDTNADRL